MIIKVESPRYFTVRIERPISGITLAPPTYILATDDTVLANADVSYKVYFTDYGLPSTMNPESYDLLYRASVVGDDMNTPIDIRVTKESDGIKFNSPVPNVRVVWALLNIA